MTWPILIITFKIIEIIIFIGNNINGGNFQEIFGNLPTIGLLNGKFPVNIRSYGKKEIVRNFFNFNGRKYIIFLNQKDFNGRKYIIFSKQKDTRAADIGSHSAEIGSHSAEIGSHSADIDTHSAEIGSHSAENSNFYDTFQTCNLYKADLQWK